MTQPLLSPGGADALLFDLGGVVLDIDFNKTLSCWAGHAGCERDDIVKAIAMGADLVGIGRLQCWALAESEPYRY
jgi:hypothetical protein